jgi:uncharacterized protein (DUF1330 family)
MPVFVIAEVKITDDKWVPAYAQKVHGLVHKHGGKYLSRSGKLETLEGAPRDSSLVAIMSFPTPKAAQAFVKDPDYAPLAAARKQGSESHFRMIDDTDVAGTIEYLPKG